jgi:hypothetical protein
MGKVGKDKLDAVVGLSERLGQLMADIAAAREKEKSLWNPAFITRVKLAKKGAELYKDLNHFEVDVANGFQKGDIPQDAGKRFIRISRLIKESKPQDAKQEFRYFEELIEARGRYGKNEEAMKEGERVLRREQLRTEKILAEMSGLENETVDLEKVRRHEELLDALAKLGKAREGYLKSLLSVPVTGLLERIEALPLEGYRLEMPGKEGMAELKRFFSDYPAFGRCTAEQLCAFFSYNERKLSHACPETSRFRKVVLENRSLFETLSSLQRTAFLAVDDENEEVLDFYAERIEGARGMVERIRELRKDKRACREEYEKSRQMEKRKAELSGYSRAALEAELKEIERLLELLHSEAPTAGGHALSGLELFLKKLFT